MGKLVIATNENDILARTLETGRYEPRDVMPTDSPSMDIQISSNFERLLFEASGRDASVRDRRQWRICASVAASAFRPRCWTPSARQFAAHRVTREEAAAAMNRLYQDTGIIVDPHTAVGLAAAQREQARLDGPMVVLGTAHPAKFPDAVKRAIGREPKCRQHFSGVWASANASRSCRIPPRPSHPISTLKSPLTPTLSPRGEGVRGGSQQRPFSPRGEGQDEGVLGLLRVTNTLQLSPRFTP